MWDINDLHRQPSINEQIKHNLMKKLFITFTICLVCICNSQLNALNYPVASIQQSSAKSIGDGYTKDWQKVFFKGKEVKYANPDSFRNLGNGYAKDNSAVFYNGIRIPGASVSSFRATQDGYATDNIRTYYRGQDASKIGRASEDDYAKISPEGYCLHESKVYYNAVEMKEADYNSFLDKSAGYAQDATNVYYNGKVLPGAKTDSFECFYDGYAKDTEKVYYNGQEIINGLSDSFDCLTYGYAKDNNYRYYMGKKIEE